MHQALQEGILTELYERPVRGNQNLSAPGPVQISNFMFYANSDEAVVVLTGGCAVSYPKRRARPAEHVDEFDNDLCLS